MVPVLGATADTSRNTAETQVTHPIRLAVRPYQKPPCDNTSCPITLAPDHTFEFEDGG